MSSVYHNTDRDLEDLEYECKKFRICIIGRTGVGKSTLLGRVFGFDDKQVR
jgi:putative ribosome biogenesis GTPase RsgA